MYVNAILKDSECEIVMDSELLELKKYIRERLKLDFIVPDELLEMSLYMEQLTSFMDEHLKGNLRREDDKILTKAMINNYTKNHLLTPPEKKRYDRDHLIHLIYIYYLKNVISIDDVKKLLNLLDSADVHGEELFDVYEKTFEMEKQQYFNIESSVMKAAQITDKKIPKDENEQLNKMIFIFLLGYDIFSKKRLIEKLIDELPEEDLDD